MRPGAALKILAGLPVGELSLVLGQQPGALRERLRGLRQMLSEAFGPKRVDSAVRMLVARCPRLLAAPLKSLAASLAALMSLRPTKVLRSGPSSMLDTLLACPDVLTLPPATLRGRFVELAAAARIDAAAVVAMILLQPRLLLAEPARVRDRLEGLTFALMVPRSSALDLVVRQPQLLLYQTETLAEHWSALQALLGIPFDAALSVVTRAPNLLCHTPELLRARLAALGATFALPRAKAALLVIEKPALLTYSTTRMEVRPSLGLVHAACVTRV